ncbi:hypothetical protein ACFXGT_10550 [Streptomyces sp. NPDC059352]|uniref:hypothetical protein n=1 Tax=Streptomyces sp. NPDC059352 TaxID=3346810 RepID=UPI003679F47C
MRPLATRRLTALAISAAITLGSSGPAVAGEHHPSAAADRADRAAHASLPEAAALLTQAEALGELGAVTTPVSELVTAALKADEGQLPGADADALKAKIATAVDQAKDTAPAPLPEMPAPDVPVTPPPVETPVDLPVKPPVGLPVTAGAKAAAGSAAPADVVADALATVEKAVAGLLAAVTSGDAGGVVPQVTATLTSLVNLAVATVLGSGLPAPSLAGLPALPALPVTAPELPVDPPELPVDPPELPVDPPVKPPVDVPELPVKPPLPVR